MNDEIEEFIQTRIAYGECYDGDYYAFEQFKVEDGEVLSIIIMERDTALQIAHHIISSLENHG